MKNTTIIALVGLCIFLFCNRGCVKRDLNEIESLYEAATAELKSTRNELGQSVGTIQNMEVTNTKHLLEIKAMNQEQARLHEIVKNNKRTKSGIAVTAVSNSEGVVATTIIDTDTVRVDSLVYLWPVYADTINTEWRHGFIVADKDSIQYSISERIELDFVQKDTGGLLKKKTSVVEVTSRNPSVEITGMASYTVKKKNKRLCIGPYLGYGYTKGGEFSTNIGIGLVYSIF